MILHYFKQKENIEQEIAKNIYKSILIISNKFLKNNSFFIYKDFNSSFELVSIYLIIFMQINIKKKIRNFHKINEHLVATLISDLDESLRSKGIGDMSIGKYVKSYVKKFYFRLSRFPKIENEFNINFFEEYLKLFDLIIEDKIEMASEKLFKEYKIIANKHIFKSIP